MAPASAQPLGENLFEKYMKFKPLDERKVSIRLLFDCGIIKSGDETYFNADKTLFRGSIDSEGMLNYRCKAHKFLIKGKTPGCFTSSVLKHWNEKHTYSVVIQQNISGWQSIYLLHGPNLDNVRNNFIVADAKKKLHEIFPKIVTINPGALKYEVEYEASDNNTTLAGNDYLICNTRPMPEENTEW